MSTPYSVNTSDIKVSYSDTSPIMPPPAQQQMQRYYVTSKIPVLTQEEIVNSLVIHNKINEILKEILIDNDRQLICNILDTSKKIILSHDQLVDLLITVLQCSGTTVTKDDIKIKFSEDIISHCLKTSVSPFKNIISIKVFEQELGQMQPEVYSALASTFKISLETFYQKLQFN